ncbi:MAG TPA: site-2 protease family protein [Myxococcaceae bacterium]|jgi:Zn-dependent protease|nr:site-2 protease family protein [Myxococcaceae bacterium]
MLRFRLGPIPVEVHPTHLVLATLLGVLALQGGSPDAWPGRELARGEPAAQLGTKLAVVLIWVAIVFVSVLIHELGHAAVGLAYRYHPSIQLVGLGGVTTSRAPGPIPWHREVVLTLAGPLVGAAFGVVCRLGEQSTGASSEVARYALGYAALANFFWAAMNLLPVLPLDGGRIAAAVLRRAFGRAGLVAAQVLALVVCLVVIRLFWGNPWIVALFGLAGLGAVRTLSSLWRGEDAVAPPDQLVQAQALYQKGQLDRARELASAVVAGDPPPAVRSLAYHLLGWIALKQGAGRRALDHFSQVQGRLVEPKALAAAFSLVGDDARAQPLWQQAYATSRRDPTLLHEWAGSLIRTGRVEEASRLEGVDMAKAYACAARVAFLRGDFSRAAELGLAGLDRHPSAGAAYDAACALARGGELDRAVLLLERARDLGFDDVDYARTDSDLAALHGHPGFERWLAALAKSAPA